MREVEVKILNISVGELEEALLALGAERVFDGDVYSLFFEGVEEGETLRLRRMNGTTYLTHKQPREGAAKVKEETEVEVRDFDTAKQLLEALGYRAGAEVLKHRTSYALPDVRFEIDNHRGQLSDIPPFLEIEAPTEEEVFAWADRLGYSRHECKPWTILDIAEHYQ